MLQEPVYTFNRTAERVIEFKGYNARGDIEDGEMRDMTNLTADEYPALYQRPPRSEWQDSPEVTYQGPRSLLVKSHFRADGSTVVQQAEKLAVIDSDGTFYYDGVPYLYGLSSNTKMVAINTKICFFPEKKYFRLVKEDSEDRIGDIDAEISITTPGTCHIGPNKWLNYVSSTLTLPAGYDLSDFNIGDAVDITVETPPLVLFVDSTVKYINPSGTTIDHYGEVDFVLSYIDGLNVVPLTNIYSWRTPSKVSKNNTYLDDLPTTSAAYKERAAAINALSQVEGYISYKELALPVGNEMLGTNSISLDKVKRFVRDSSTSRYFRLTYSFEDDNEATTTFDINESHDYSEQRQYASGGVVPVSGVVQDIYNNSLTIGDNAFHNAEGYQFDDEDVAFTSISITRKSPDLDFVMEHNNRLWGCSNADNTIYACKLGDPTNWAYFQSTSLDSYYAEQGSDGEWTGCAPYSSHLCFFKEDVIHKVYGSYPSEFQIVTAICQGVESGSSDSLAFLNDSIFYKSRVGIMAYSGGYPENISREFGNAKYSNVVGGTDGRRYYASMEDEDGDHVLMCFDTDYNTWHKEDDLDVKDFAYIDGKLVYAEAGNPSIMEMYSSVPEDDPIEWEAVLGPYDEYIAEKKIYSRIKLRYKMPVGSSFKVYISADEGPWTEAATVTSASDRIEEVFVTPIRCDCFSIKIAGTGYCRLRSVVREYRTSTMRKEV